MIETDSVRYIVEYIISVVASFLLFGMGLLLFVTRYKAHRSIFYSKMLKQWLPSLFFVFIIIVLARFMICYFYFPTLFASTFVLTLYAFFIVIGITLISTVYLYARRNALPSLFIYAITFIITSLSELVITLIIAHTFYNQHIPYQEILQPTFLLFLTRVLPYSLVLSSLIYSLITIARKHKDSYGRDYYIFTLQYCVKIAYSSSLALCLLGSISAIILTVLLSTNLSLSVLLTCILFMPALIFSYVFFLLRRISISNLNPLQYKSTFAFSLLLSLLALCIDIVAVQPYLL